MKKNINYSGIEICDSIVMSVKKRKLSLRKFEAVFIALLGFVSVIMSFLSMFSLSYSRTAVIYSALISAAVYIAFSLAARLTLWLTGVSFIILAAAAYNYLDRIINGFKYVYNIIYCDAKKTEVLYYKNLDPDNEYICTTFFLCFCIWLLALVIFTFTIRRPSPLVVLIFTFPVIEIGLYNGISIPIMWGMLTIAYWLAVMAISSIDLGEYYGGSGGFVRKDDLFFPKRQMRFKVTERCGILVIFTIAILTAGTLGVMELTGYQRSEELNKKRIEIKEAYLEFSYDDLVSSISNFTEIFGVTLDYDTQKLGNVDHVTLKNTTDLEVTFSKKCSNALYLKDYTGAVYGDNEWNVLKKSAYRKADGLFDEFDKLGIYPQDFPHIFSQYISPDSSDITIWIDPKRKKNKTYAPYGTNNYGDMSYSKDNNVSAENSKNSGYSYKFTEIEPWSISEEVYYPEEIYIASDSIRHSSIVEYCEKNDLISADGTVAVENALASVNSEILSSDTGLLAASLLENSYRSFVYDNYLQIPKNDQLAEVEKEFGSILASAEDAVTAEEKLEVLNSLRDRVNELSEYTLSPGETPSNRDFVNYFLLENHKGYCIHYATSGVILARMAGIPARYATGYVLVGDDFSNAKQNPDGTYTIKVKDERAHAWTEVYLDGFGWVPFEFTKGYSNTSINTAPETTTAQENTKQQSVTTTAADPSAEQTTQSKSSRTSSTQSEPATSVTTTSAPAPGNAASTSASDDSMDPVLKYILIAAGVIILIAALAIVRRRIILSRRKKALASGSPDSRIIHAYEYTEKLLAFLKLRQGNMQYNEFAAVAEEKLSPEFFTAGSFRRLTELALECSFGNEQCDAAQAEYAAEFSTKLAENVYAKSGIFRKISLKILRVLI